MKVNLKVKFTWQQAMKVQTERERERETDRERERVEEQLYSFFNLGAT